MAYLIVLRLALWSVTIFGIMLAMPMVFPLRRLLLEDILTVGTEDVIP
jgi:hypothetical protein